MNQNSLFLLLQTQPFPRFQKSHNHSLCFGLSKTECEWLLMTEAKIAYKNSPQVKQSVQVKHSVDSCIAESAAVPMQLDPFEITTIGNNNCKILLSDTIAS